MSWTEILNPDIDAYIKAHKNENIQTLALKKMPDSWPRLEILNQIKARQKAEKKMPQWAKTSETNALVFPHPDTIEQASSEATATYKASLFSGKTCLDLTGGAGIDFSACIKHFDHGICIEKNSETAGILQHNMPLLHPSKTITVINTDAQSYLGSLKDEHFDLIYIDPQRRDDNQRKTVRLEDHQPNVLEIIDQLLKHGKTIMIKTSPMLDIHQTCTALPHTSAVHIIETHNECKEVLYILNPEQQGGDSPITALKIDQSGAPSHTLTFTTKQEKESTLDIAEPQDYLYEPGPAFMKSGAFKMIGSTYGLQKLHAHTHLYTANTINPDFPGKIFKITNILDSKTKDLAGKQFNLAVRNFPSTPDALKKKLKIKDGGNHMIFACTLSNDKKVLIVCEAIRI